VPLLSQLLGVLAAQHGVVDQSLMHLEVTEELAA